MGLLEDRLLRIIELKRQRMSDVAIAQTLGITEEDVPRYLQTSQEQIEAARTTGVTSPLEIAAQLGISPIVYGLVSEFLENPPQESPKLNDHVSSLDFSVRVANCLHYAGIETVQDLAKKNKI